MPSGTPKPISRYGLADDNGIYRWEGSYLWWPERVFPNGDAVGGLLVTRTIQQLAQCDRYPCPTDVIQRANLAYSIDERVDFENEEAFLQGHWPRRFNNFKNRNGNVQHEIVLNKVDFILTMLIR
jgi:hypothetical protein